MSIKVSNKKPCKRVSNFSVTFKDLNRNSFLLTLQQSILKNAKWITIDLF